VKPPPKFIRVFLVEDNLPDERLLRELLKEFGGGQFIMCGVFRTLSEAIVGLENAGGVDVVLLDLSLPDAHGIETFSRLAAAVPDQPVVVLSGYDDEQLAVETVHQGAQDYLVKYELSGRLLVRSLNYAIERKRAEVALKNIREELEKKVEERTRSLSKANQRLSEVLDELKVARSQSPTQERLHAIDRLAGGIAHDFNNALSPILAHSEWLLRKPGALRDEITLRKALCNMHESAGHCAEVVLRLRDFCRASDEHAPLELLDLCDVVREAVSLTQPSWKDQAQMRGCNIALETDFASVPKIRGAREDLLEMFTNLILNSVDAIRLNGVISISIFSPEEGPVTVCISDNGEGMSEEGGAPSLTSSDESRKGLELGVIYGIAQRHDAEVNLEGWGEDGTKVTVKFPVALPEIVPVQAEKAKEGAVAPLTGLRILAVEDEPNIREILGIYLTEDGHTVELAAEGGEALTKFKRDQFDLLLTDYSMPNMNGDRLAAAVRAADPKIRIALLTGFGSQLPQGAPLRLEVDAIIAKPFTFETLRQGIAEAMGG
jgi:CheY-like chemotaxis protein